MSESLYMLQLRLNPQHLLRFAQDHGINRAWDEDLGYALHAWLAATLGALAPKPFRLLNLNSAWRKGQRLQVLGYSAHDGATLREYAETFAQPLALAVCNPEELSATKRMPSTWVTGRRLGFEVLTCPTVRPSRRGIERDVFLYRVDMASETEQHRATVYAEWLEQQWQDVVKLESVRLEGFDLVRMMRRGKVAADASGRALRRLVYPQALLRGVMTVQDGGGFAKVLARGLGRHRAFGYGMVLLRP